METGDRHQRAFALRIGADLHEGRNVDNSRALALESQVTCDAVAVGLDRRKSPLTVESDGNRMGCETWGSRTGNQRFFGGG